MTPSALPLSGWTVSLDLWGTLLTNGDRKAAAGWRLTEFGRVLDVYGHHPAPEKLSEIVGRTRKEAAHQQRTTGAQPDVEAQVGAVLDELGIDRETPDLLKLLLAVHTHAVLRACPQPIPGAIATLDAIKAAGGRLVLTSNTLATPSDVHRLLLTDLGLLDRFDDVLFSGDLRVAKPRREVFAAVAERAGTPLERIVHVGDDPLTDVDGALGAGCHAVHYNPRREATARPRVPDFADHAELPALLVSLHGAAAAKPISRSASHD
ncbi:HAD family hydrolase [Streptomyces sp. NPDC051018]|uniref:HAD family hydrolase n=1 Tax=Streptomyces sp. NPDC051018 TaxID=3365639 RepID=UPI0037A9B7A4